MDENNKPKIFLSYSWKNAAIADEIDNDLKKEGICLTRDIRDLHFKKSIKEFMHSIGQHDYVLMLISDEYLRSENCMYEVNELLATHEFQDRILPIISENAYHIFDSAGRSIYFDYWKNKRQLANKDNNKYKNQSTIDTLRKITSIYNVIDLFFYKLIDLNIYTLTYLKQQGYTPLFYAIKPEDEVQQWDRIKDSNQHDEFEKYISNYPNGDFLSEAKEKIIAIEDIAKEKEDWEKIEKSDDLSKLNDFAKIYPNSNNINEINRRIKAQTDLNEKEQKNKREQELEKVKTLANEVVKPIINKKKDPPIIPRVYNKPIAKITEDASSGGFGKKTDWAKLYLLIGVVVLIIIVIVIINNFKRNGSTSRYDYDTTKMDSAKMHTTKTDTAKRMSADTTKKAGSLRGTYGNYELIDNFDDNRNGWPIYSDEKKKMSIEKGKFTIQGLTDGDFTALITPNIDINKDFTCSVTAKWINGINNGGFGIEFCSGRVGADDYWYSFMISADGAYIIAYLKNNANIKYLNDWQNLYAIKKGPVENILKIRRVNNRFYFYINGDKLVKTIPAKGVYGNAFGIELDDKQAVKFDDFKIEGTTK